MGQSTLLKIAALCLTTATVPSTIAFSAASQALHPSVLERADSTCTTNYTTCGQGLPANFCCPSSTTCQPFNGGKSAICCPAGQSCSLISPISCDITLQDPVLHDASQLYTTDLSASLQPCGKACCPNGYTCQGNGCQLSSGSTATSSLTSTGASSTPVSSSNSVTSSSPSNQPTSSSTSPTQTAAAGSAQGSGPAAEYNKFPAAAVLAGFFPGLVAGILLAVIALCCFGRRRSKKELEPPSPDFSSVTATVSDPIYQPEGNNAFRTDFLRRQSKSKHANRTSKVRSLFSRTPTLRSMKSRDAPVDGIGRSIPKVPETPINQRSPEASLKKEPSMESIKIYSPPNGGLGRPGTTFAEMLREAGFKHGEPYLGSPGRVDPRSRDIGEV